MSGADCETVSLPKKRRGDQCGQQNTRQDSVSKGLGHLRENENAAADDVILVHDGVRPFVPSNLITSCTQAALEFGACVPAIRIADTIKSTQSDNTIHKTLDRDNLVAVQTPQAFRLSILTDAIAFAAKTGFTGTDDASLVEHFDKDVRIVEGTKRNLKITTREDLELALYLCSK